MPSYLQKRRRRWYATLEIPKALRPQFGRPRFVQSLETESRTVAERRVLQVVAAWKQLIAEAKGENDHKVWIATAPVRASKEWSAAFRLRHPDYVPKRQTLDPRGHGYELSANAMRIAYQQAKAKGDKEQVALIEMEIADAADYIGALNVDFGTQPSTDPEAQRFYAKATGQLVSFTEHLDEWLATSRATAKTIDMQRSDVKRFAATFATVQDVTRPEVRRWITGLMNDEGLTPKTVQRILSALRGYWRYLQSIEVAGEDHEPFNKLDVARHNKRTEPRSARQPFEPGDVVRLLDAAIDRGDDQLADLVRLGMWTGCRIEELCALKVDQVKDDHFTVEDAKTEAGWRDVPIHRDLAQTMARLIEGSKDGHVLSGLTVNKYGDRSNGIGKRFGRLKTESGFGSQLVFHSIRKTVVTILENAGVPENVVADIVGHEKTTMTYGLYSGGLSLAVRREALDKLAY